MRPLAFASSLAAGAAALFAPSGAAAQTPFLYDQKPSPPSAPRAPEPPGSAWASKGLLGFELELSAGVFVPDSGSPVLAPSLYPPIGGDATGDILEGKESPYGWDVGVRASAGYRFLPFLSAGAFFDAASFQALDGTDTGDYRDTTSQLQRAVWQLGAYVRYYLVGLHPKLQPWAQLGVGYSTDTASYTRAAIQGGSGAVTQDYYLSHHGLVVPLTAGLDWRLAPVFSVGPEIGYLRVIGLSACVDSELQTDSSHPGPPGLGSVSTCSSPPVEANGYGIFFAGLFAKVTFGPGVPAPDGKTAAR
jgi:hypothetical protein